MSHKWQGVTVDGLTPRQMADRLQAWFKDPEALTRRMKGLVDKAPDEAHRAFWEEVLSLLTSQLRLPL